VGPLGGVIADRLDRRLTMVVCDVARFALFLSIPIVGTLWWLLTATFLIETASLIWIPAKEATLPNSCRAGAQAVTSSACSRRTDRRQSPRP
jgi:dTMP kinase